MRRRNRSKRERKDRTEENKIRQDRTRQDNTSNKKAKNKRQNNITQHTRQDKANSLLHYSQGGYLMCTAQPPAFKTNTETDFNKRLKLLWWPNFG